MQNIDRETDGLIELGSASVATQGMGGPRFDLVGPAPQTAIDED